MSGLALIAAGMLWGQGGMPQGQYPQQGQYPGQQNPQGQGQYPQQPGMENQTQPVNVMSDQDFAKEAAQGGMAEVKLGQLAQEKGSSDAVKNFGKQMVEDHSKANDQLKTAASQANFQLPAEIAKKDQKTYNQLSKLNGEAFDRAYAKDMVKDHENDISDFKQEASSGRNAAIKNFASQTLPTLEDHLKMAREMQRTVNSSNAKPGGE